MSKIIHCKECKYQTKTFHKDKRYAAGGYYTYRCKLISDPFTHTPVEGLDDQFCSAAEEKEKEKGSNNGEVNQAADPRINPFYGMFNEFAR